MFPNQKSLFINADAGKDMMFNCRIVSIYLSITLSFKHLTFETVQKLVSRVDTCKVRIAANHFPSPIYPARANEYDNLTRTLSP